MILRPTRRQLLGGLAATSAGLALGGRARADASVERRFIFVQALGGWDITQVFAPLFGSTDVHMDDGGALASWGAIDYVDHPARPAVPAFFSSWGDRTALVHGIYVASIAHTSAVRLMLSGSLDATEADWATRIGAGSLVDPVLPHLVVGGLYYAGDRGVHVGRAGSSGQLQGLSSGDLLTLSDQAVLAPDPTRSALVDEWLAGAVTRAHAAAATARRARKLDAHGQALARAVRVKDMVDALSFEGGEAFDQQVDVAIAALQAGVSRVVTLSHPGRDEQVAWDSHALNESTQSALFERLFTDLSALLARLDATPSGSGTMADDTVVVVLSEMSRSPTVNGSNGRDHWPCTTAMLIGPGVSGGRMVGGYNDRMFGRPVDLATAESHDDGTWLGPEHLGATLLALADIDPASEGVAGDPIAGILT